MKLVDIKIGLRVGRLTVVSEPFVDRSGTSKFKRSSKVECHCDCGNRKVITVKSIGRTQSCGCLHRDGLVNKLTTHGKSKSPEYEVYHGMKKRCYNHKSADYKFYGGRGIKVCDRWLGENGFDKFLTDMGERPSQHYSIDRKDVNGNYEPSNCRWITHKGQMNNVRTNIIINRNGVSKTLKMWCEEIGLSYQMAYARYKNGLSVDEILCSKHFRKIEIEYNGVVKSLMEWCRVYNVSRHSASERLKKGYSFESVFINPPESKIFITHDGVGKSLRQWAIQYGVTYATAYQRYNKGWPFEQIFNRERSNGVLYERFGVNQPLEEWCRVYGVAHKTAMSRRSEGWSFERIMELQPHHPNNSRVLLPLGK